MNAQKANRGLTLSSYATTLGEAQKTRYTKEIERKMRADDFIGPMWVFPKKDK